MNFGVEPGHFHTPQKPANTQADVPRGVLGAISFGAHKTALVAIIFMCLAFFLLIFSAGRMHAQKLMLGRAELIQPGSGVLRSYSDALLSHPGTMLSHADVALGTASPSSEEFDLADDEPAYQDDSELDKPKGAVGVADSMHSQRKIVTGYPPLVFIIQK